MSIMKVDSSKLIATSMSRKTIVVGVISSSNFVLLGWSPLKESDGRILECFSQEWNYCIKSINQYISSFIAYKYHTSLTCCFQSIFPNLCQLWLFHFQRSWGSIGGWKVCCGWVRVAQPPFPAQRWNLNIKDEKLWNMKKRDEYHWIFMFSLQFAPPRVNLLTTLPNLTKQWKVEFGFKPTNLKHEHWV